MANATMGPDIGKSALIIVDMQNDFVHPEGDFAHSARETPEAMKPRGDPDRDFRQGFGGPAD